MRSVLRRTAVIFLTLLSILTLFPSGVFADGEKATVTIKYHWDGTPIPGATFDLYRVADEDMELVDGFVKYKDQIEYGKGTAAWDGLALKLKGFVERDNIQIVQSGTTGSDGKVTLSDLEPGLYLCLGSRSTINNVAYTPVPFMVFMPNMKSDGKLEYDVTVEPKKERYNVIAVDCSVQKRIEGAPQSDAAFSFSLTAKDDSCPMPEGSNGLTKWLTINGAGSSKFGNIFFTYPGTYTYYIKENNTGVSGYTYDTQTYTLTYIVSEDASENLKVSETKLVNGKGETVSTAVFTNYYKDPGPKLPYTGQLWWPVPILAVLGAAFLTAGIIRRRRNAE